MDHIYPKNKTLIDLENNRNLSEIETDVITLKQPTINNLHDDNKNNENVFETKEEENQLEKKSDEKLDNNNNDLENPTKE